MGILPCIGQWVDNIIRNRNKLAMSGGGSSNGGKKNRVEYWWPGERAVNTRDYLLTASYRRLHGERVPLEQVMTTLQSTLREDKVPRDRYPSKEQVNNWFQRHRYKAWSVI